jgi:hypothetical protein
MQQWHNIERINTNQLLLKPEVYDNRTLLLSVAIRYTSVINTVAVISHYRNCSYRQFRYYM